MEYEISDQPQEGYRPERYALNGEFVELEDDLPEDDQQMR